MCRSGQTGRIKAPLAFCLQRFESFHPHMKKKRDLRNADGWRKALENLPKAYKEWFKEEKEFLIENIKKDSKILEVGCGDGKSINDVLEISENITGLDIDEGSVQIAKARFAKFKKVKIVLGDANSLPFKNQSFDYVTCIGTFANFGKDKFRVLEEMKRVLSYEGKIIISVYSDESLNERLTLYKKLNFKLKGVDEVNGIVTCIFDDFNTEGVSEQFSEKQIYEIASRVNLKVEKIQKTQNKIAYFVLLSKII